MRTYTKRLHVRVSPDEYAAAKQFADSAGISMAAYYRLLMQMPMRYDAHPTTAVVLDFSTTTQIAKELRRWGYHYNQGIHALNALAYYARLNKLDADDIREQIAMAHTLLHDVNDAALGINASIAEVSAKPVLFK
jgi:hypothetical protein